MIKSGEICLDENKSMVIIRDKRGKTECNLPSKEFETLKYLVNNEGKIITRELLLDKVWGPDYDEDIRIVDITIRRLREKIEINTANPKIIKTQHGIGYYYNKSKNEPESEILLKKIKNEIEEESLITRTYEKSSQFNLTLFLEALVSCEKNKQILEKILENQVDYYYDILNKTKNINRTNQICEMLLKEINDTKNELIKINTYYNQLISLNVIYPKYNNFIAITTFYEYFLSGRCDSLSGSTGAYNLYENELRANIIINKFDIIIEKLDDIKNNQYQMYCILKEINSTQKTMITAFNTAFDNILDSIGQLNKNIKEIEQIETITAYNTAKIAEIETITAYNTAKIAQYSQINNKILNDMKCLLFIK